MGLSSGADAESSEHRQLLLTLEPPPGKSLDNFISTGNEVAVRQLRDLCAGAASGHRQIYLWGAASCGKSHLLQAACGAVTARGGRSAWLPLSQLLRRGAEVLSGWETLDLIALDELDVVADKPDWQHALFSLINETRSTACGLAIAGRQNPTTMRFDLKDLASRLVWGAMHCVEPLDDAHKIKVLRDVGERLGCVPAEDSLVYLLSNHSRDLAALVAMVERLAQAAKQHKRRITVPLVKAVLPPTA